MLKRVFFVVFVAFFTPFFVLAATISSTETGGAWTESATWVGGVLPISSDEVEIVENSRVEVGCSEVISSKIINKGEFKITCSDFDQSPVLNNDLNNFGKVIGVFSLKGYLYNQGEIDDTFYLYQNQSTNLVKIKNSGYIAGVILKEGISFDADSDFNFQINGGGYEAKIFADITIEKSTQDIKFTSDQKRKIFLKQSSNLNGDKNIELTISENNLTLIGEKDFEKIIVPVNTIVNVVGGVFNSDIENAGELNGDFSLKGNLNNSGKITDIISLYKVNCEAREDALGCKNQVTGINKFINAGTIEKKVQLKEDEIEFSNDSVFSNISLTGASGSSYSRRSYKAFLNSNASFTRLEYVRLETKGDKKVNLNLSEYSRYLYGHKDVTLILDGANISLSDFHGDFEKIKITSGSKVGGFRLDSNLENNGEITGTLEVFGKYIDSKYISKIVNNGKIKKILLNHDIEFETGSIFNDLKVEGNNNEITLSGNATFKELYNTKLISKTGEDIVATITYNMSGVTAGDHVILNFTGTNQKIIIDEGETKNFACDEVINLEVINSGEMKMAGCGYGQTEPLFNQKITNEGKITGNFGLTGELVSSGQINNHIYLYKKKVNCEAGEVALGCIDTGINKIKNTIAIEGEVQLKEDNIEFSSDSIFNFALNGRYIKNHSALTYAIILNSDAEFTKIYQAKINSKSNQKIRVRVTESVSEAYGDSNTTLVLDGQSLTISESLNNFEKIEITSGSKVKFYDAVVNSDILNNGETTGKIKLSDEVHELVNNGKIENITLQRNIEFTNDSVFGSSTIDGNNKEIYLSQNTTLFGLYNSKIISKTGSPITVEITDTMINVKAGSNVTLNFTGVNTKMYIAEGEKVIFNCNETTNLEVENHGEMEIKNCSYGQTKPLFNNKITNYGKITGYDFELKNDLVNSGEIERGFWLYKNIETGINKIQNTGTINGIIYLKENDIEFTGDSDLSGVSLNARFSYSSWYNAIFNSDITVGALSNIKTKSKDDLPIEIRVQENIYKVYGSENVLLALDGANVRVDGFLGYFSKIKIAENTKVIWNASHSVYSDIENHGSIEGVLKLSKNSLNKKVQNYGKINKLFLVQDLEFSEDSIFGDVILDGNNTNITLSKNAEFTEVYNANIETNSSEEIEVIVKDILLDTIAGENVNLNFTGTNKIVIANGESRTFSCNEKVDLEIENNGEINIASCSINRWPIFNKKLINNGKITGSTFVIKNDFENSGEIQGSVYLYKNTETGINKFKNTGVMDRAVELKEDNIEFSSDSVFDAYFQGRKNIILNSDAEFARLNYVKLKSKGDKEIKVKVSKHINQIYGDLNISLILDGESIAVYDYVKDFKKVEISEDSKAIFQNIEINSEVINNGDLELKKSGYRKYVKFFGTLKNHGKIYGGDFILENNLYNYGTISQHFDLKQDLYNSGNISNRINLYKNQDTGINRFVNTGEISNWIYLKEDGISFPSWTNYNFKLNGENRDLVLNYGTHFLGLSNFNLESFDGELKNITISDEIQSVTTDGNIGLIFDSSEKIRTQARYVNNFKQLITTPQTEVEFRGKDVLQTKVINNGKILTYDNSGWGKKDELTFEKDLENNGEIDVDYLNIKNDFENYGKVFGNIYLYKNLNKAENIFKNRGEIGNIYLQENIVLSAESILNNENYGFFGGNKELTISSGIKFGHLSSLKIKSLNLGTNVIVASRVDGITGDSNTNLILNNRESEIVVKRTISGFNLIFIPRNTKAKWDYNYSPIIKSDLINNGQINFGYYDSNPYNKRFVIFTKDIINEGVLEGSSFYALEDESQFKYIVSENEVLTSAEELELEEKSEVSYTDDMIPFLTSTTQYFLHTKKTTEGAQKVDLKVQKEVTFPPLLELIGNAKVIVKQGEIYTEQGSKAESFHDGDLTSQIQTQGVVDTATIGTYTITYKVTDSKGSTVQTQRIVTVEKKDSEEPSIDINGQENMDIKLNLTYTEQGATALDNVDGNLNHKIKITGFVDTERLGTYYVIYTVKDSSGNQSSKTRTVNIVKHDQVYPTITLDGDSTKYLTLGQDYVEQGAKALDDQDGDLTSEIITTGAVDTNTIGTYTVTYKVSDSWENETTETRTVHIQAQDQEAPIITLNGDSLIILDVNAEYIEQGANSLDDEDGDLTSQISVVGTVDTTIPGTYIKTYTSTDSTGNTSSIERTVKVNAQASVSSSRSSSSSSSSSSNQSANILDAFLGSEEDEEQTETEKLEEEQELASPIPADPSLRDEVEAIQKKDYKLISTCLSLNSEKSYLSKGLNLPEIKTLQNFLKSQEYLDIQNTTSYFGNQTYKALQEFQKDNEIISTGIFGRITARYIDNNCNNLKTKTEFEKLRSKASKLEEEERLAEERKKAEEEKQDFAEQNPAPTKEKPPVSSPTKPEAKQKNQQAGILDNVGDGIGKIVSEGINFLRDTKRDVLDFFENNEKLWDEEIKLDSDDREIQNWIFLTKTQLNQKKDKDVNGINSLIKKKIKEKEKFLGGSNQFEIWYAKLVKFCWFECDTRIMARKKIEKHSSLLNLYEKYIKSEKLRVKSVNNSSQNYFNERNKTMIQNTKKESGDLTKPMYIEGGKEWHDITIRKVNIEIGKNVDKKVSNNNNTYILIHGWKTNIQENNVWVKKMKDAILTKDSEAQIIYVNWYDIMKHEPWIDPIQPETKATWIDVTAVAITEKLKNWGIKPENTTIIGHSMGTILGARISEQFNGVKIKKLTALDPASSAGWYETNTGNNEFTTFSNTAQKIRCFVGEDSEAGSETLAKTCDKRYIMDFHKRLGSSEEHQEVVNKYREIIKGEYFGKEKYLSFENNNDNFPTTNSFNGIIDIRELKDENNKKIKEELNYLKVTTRKNPTYITKIGTKNNNIFSCDESKNCIIEGYEGDDEIKQAEKDLVILDFKKKRFNKITKQNEIDSDVLIIKKDFEKENFSKIKFQGNTGILLTLKYDPMIGFDYSRWVFLEGVSESDVKDWIDITNNILPESYKSKHTIFDLPDLQKSNPIQIE